PSNPSHPPPPATRMRFAHGHTRVGGDSPFHPLLHPLRDGVTMSASTGVEPIHTELLIGGAEIRAGGQEPVRNPAAPDEVVGYISAATREHATAAVDAAVAAWPIWSEMSAGKRAGILTSALQGLGQEQARAELLTRENGKVLQEAQIELGVRRTVSARRVTGRSARHQ